MGRHDVGGGAEGVRGERFSLGCDDLRALLPLGLRLAGHGPLHAVGQQDVLELDQGDDDAPLGGLLVEDLPDADVDAVRLGQRLVQRVLADHLAERSLRDLADGRRDVLDGDHRLLGVDHAVVGDGGDVHADGVAGDDAL
jgi:hypothetical protein